jgi:putative transposase
MAPFVIDLKTRRIVVAGISPSPDGQWVAQLARYLTDLDVGFLRGSRYLIHDRDPLLTKAFEVTLESAGIEAVRLPARSPNSNASAGRLLRSIKSECLAQVILLSERHLRRVVKAYTEHYYRERNHQGLDNELIDGHAEDYSRCGPIECRDRLGELLRHYPRAA